LVNCVYLDHDSCETGGAMEDAFKYVTSNGLCLKEDWDYDETAKVAGACDVNCTVATNSAIKGYATVPQTEIDLMKAVADQVSERERSALR